MLVLYANELIEIHVMYFFFCRLERLKISEVV